MINLTDPPLAPGQQVVITYNEALHSISALVSDKMYYMSLFLLFYILMNMFVLKNKAKLRPRFEKLDPEIQFWVSELTEDIALVAGLFLVAFNIIFRMGLNI